MIKYYKKNDIIYRIENNRLYFRSKHSKKYWITTYNYGKEIDDYIISNELTEISVEEVFLEML